MVERWTTDAAIAACVDTPPQTTRARLRGEFLQTARRLGANVTVDWTRLKVNRPEPHTEEFSDPFVFEDARLQALLDYMEHNA